MSRFPPPIFFFTYKSVSCKYLAEVLGWRWYINNYNFKIFCLSHFTLQCVKVTKLTGCMPVLWISQQQDHVQQQAIAVKVVCLATTMTKLWFKAKKWLHSLTEQFLLQQLNCQFQDVTVQVTCTQNKEN